MISPEILSLMSRGMKKAIIVNVSIGLLVDGLGFLCLACFSIDPSWPTYNFITKTLIILLGLFFLGIGSLLTINGLFKTQKKHNRVIELLTQTPEQIKRIYHYRTKSKSAPQKPDGSFVGEQNYIRFELIDGSMHQIMMARENVNTVLEACGKHAPHTVKTNT